MFENIFTLEALWALLTLILMEVVLGIDNIVFISIISGKVEKKQQRKAQNYGLILALIPRIILLLFITWIVALKDPVIEFESLNLHLSWKDIILLLGGLFLLYKSTTEIHEKLEGGKHGNGTKNSGTLSFSTAIIQIILLNIVFSFDSILTAVGLVEQVSIMIIAVVIASLIMMVFAGTISDFVNKHPTVKMLALSFLLMIGFLLVTESLHQEVPKGYVYFAMAFSLIVEILNLRMAKNADPVKLKKRFEEE